MPLSASGLAEAQRNQGEPLGETLRARPRISAGSLAPPHGLRPRLRSGVAQQAGAAKRGRRAQRHTRHLSSRSSSRPSTRYARSRRQGGASRDELPWGLKSSFGRSWFEMARCRDRPQSRTARRLRASAPAASSTPGPRPAAVIYLRRAREQVLEHRDLGVHQWCGLGRRSRARNRSSLEQPELFNGGPEERRQLA